MTDSRMFNMSRGETDTTMIMDIICSRKRISDLIEMYLSKETHFILIR